MCVYVYMCVYMYVCIYVCVCIHTCVHVYILMYIKDRFASKLITMEEMVLMQLMHSSSHSKSLRIFKTVLQMCSFFADFTCEL